MALVPGTYFLSATWIDSGSNTRTYTYPMTATTDLDADTEALTVVGNWQAISEAALLEYHWYQAVNEDAPAPAAGSQVENQALLSYQVDGSLTRQAVVSVPAPVIGIFSAPSGPGSNIVDASDPALVTFNAMFLSGGLLTFKDGEVSDSFIQGKRIHRKSNRG